MVERVGEACSAARAHVAVRTLDGEGVGEGDGRGLILRHGGWMDGWMDGYKKGLNPTVDPNLSQAQTMYINEGCI